MLNYSGFIKEDENRVGIFFIFFNFKIKENKFIIMRYKKVLIGIV